MASLSVTPALSDYTHIHIDRSKLRKVEICSCKQLSKFPTFAFHAAASESGTDNVTIDKKVQEAVNETLEELGQDLKKASEKYDLESELFAEVDFARINAFTDTPFAGNPAAICFLPYEKDDKWLQLVAKEFNISVTAFLIKRKENDAANEFDLRWFAPEVELDFCGHGTLAAAHLLFSTVVDTDDIIFHTKAGILTATKIAGFELPAEVADERVMQLEKPEKRPSGKGEVELNFPLTSCEECSPSEAVEVSKAIPSNIVWCGKTNRGDYLVELRSSEDVKEVKPKYSEMMEVSGRGGFIVTAADSDYDFVSRFFCPKSGIPEDPVTGSAHCVLAPYWSKKLKKKIMQAKQISERGGKLSVRVDDDEERVYVQGCAILVMAGCMMNVVP